MGMLRNFVHAMNYLVYFTIRSMKNAFI